MYIKKISIFISIIITLTFSSITWAKKAPDFEILDNLTHVKLSSFRGQVIYLDFWASWCGPCRQTFPFMNNMQKKYGDKGLKIIAVTIDTDLNKASAFLKENPANFSIVYDPDKKISRDYNQSVIPTSYLINRQGYIVFKHMGFRAGDEKSLEAKIKTVILENDISGP